VWNTFVMVGTVTAFLDMIEETLPGLRALLSPAPLSPAGETLINPATYHALPEINFSDRVLQHAVDHLLLLRLNDVVWSDLGEPKRATLAAPHLLRLVRRPALTQMGEACEDAVLR